MRYMTRTGPAWLLVALAILVAAWLVLSVLLIATQGNPGAFLTATFGRSGRPDAFEFVSGVSVLLWWMHSCVVLIAIAASHWHRTDVVVVLLIGPVIALTIALLGQNWEDPNWHDFIAVCIIGWFVSTVVTGCYWMLQWRTGPPC